MAKSLIEQLMDQVVEKLLAKIESGEATASDYANAIRLLNDNGIRLDPTAKPTKDLAKDVPFSEDEYKALLEG